MGDLINELLAQLRAITQIQFSTVWNNQFEYIKDGGSYSFPMPCSFVEVQSNNLEQLSMNYQGSDLDITIHIGQNILNSELLDENLTIFVLRDLVVKSLCNFKPTTASQMVKISEEQDFDHSNVYHYKITFRTHWIDDTSVNQQYLTTPPINPIVTHTP